MVWNKLITAGVDIEGNAAFPRRRPRFNGHISPCNTSPNSWRRRSNMAGSRIGPHRSWRRTFRDFTLAVGLTALSSAAFAQKVNGPFGAGGPMQAGPVQMVSKPGNSPPADHLFERFLNCPTCSSTQSKQELEGSTMKNYQLSKPRTTGRQSLGRELTVCGVTVLLAGSLAAQDMEAY